MRRAAKRDDNEGAIVRALQALGATVYQLDQPVDLLVGFLGQTHLLEVKDGSKAPSDRKLTAPQEKFFRSWRGRPPKKVESIQEALAAIGVKST